MAFRSASSSIGNFSAPPEAPLPGELSSECETERLDEGTAYRCVDALSCRACPLRHACGVPPLPEGEALAFRSASSSIGNFSAPPEAPLPGATTTTAASGGNRESLLGPRPARRKRSAANAGCRNPALSSECARLRGWIKTEPSLCRKVRLVASLPVSFCRSLWYTYFSALPAHFIGKGVRQMPSISTFILSVAANVASYYICKWLDGWFTGRKH